MTTFTHMALPPTSPMPFLRLMPHVEAALVASGVRPTEFGSRVARDPGLLRDIRDRGRRPSVKLRLKMQHYADHLLADARARALATLLSTGGVGDVVESLIAALDERDGDPDVEENGDEFDGSLAEDDFHAPGSRDETPGCPLSDPAEFAGDEQDAAWIERGEDGQPASMDVGNREATEDDEPEEDHCLAGDDMVHAGPVEHRGMWLDRGRSSGWEIGDEVDGERGRQPAETPIAANGAQP